MLEVQEDHGGCGMNQMELFYDAGHGINAPMAFPARRTDPATSKQAAREIVADGTMGDGIAIAADAVMRWPGHTSSELQELSDGRNGGRRISMHKRLPDAAKRMMVERRDARTCRVTGKQAVTWWPT